MSKFSQTSEEQLRANLLKFSYNIGLAVFALLFLIMFLLPQGRMEVTYGLNGAYGNVTNEFGMTDSFDLLLLLTDEDYDLNSFGEEFEEKVEAEIPPGIWSQMQLSGYHSLKTREKNLVKAAVSKINYLRVLAAEESRPLNGSTITFIMLSALVAFVGIVVSIMFLISLLFNLKNAPYGKFFASTFFAIVFSIATTQCVLVSFISTGVKVAAAPVLAVLLSVIGLVGLIVWDCFNAKKTPDVLKFVKCGATISLSLLILWTMFLPAINFKYKSQDYVHNDNESFVSFLKMTDVNSLDDQDYDDYFLGAYGQNGIKMIENTADVLSVYDSIDSSYVRKRTIMNYLKQHNSVLVLCTEDFEDYAIETGMATMIPYITLITALLTVAVGAMSMAEVTGAKKHVSGLQNLFLIISGVLLAINFVFVGVSVGSMLFAFDGVDALKNVSMTLYPLLGIILSFGTFVGRMVISVNSKKEVAKAKNSAAEVK